MKSTIAIFWIVQKHGAQVDEKPIFDISPKIANVKSNASFTFTVTFNPN